MSTYITALVAGEYHEVLDTYAGKHGEIPLGHYCRQSLVEHLDREELVKLTKQGFEYFEEAFGFPYPFEKYDQLYVPEYNMGAMENAGCVTLRDVPPRSRQDRSFYEFRCSVILHEMAHMWFGDLVTMRWWDDLWLNEVLRRVGVLPRRRRGDRVRRVVDRLHQRAQELGLPPGPAASTHPVAADNHDLQAVEVNFDGITYAKGASILKQLVAWVGLENFLSGLGEYFREHAYNSAEFADLLGALEKVVGPRAVGLGARVAADLGRQHAARRVHPRRRGRLRLVRGRADRGAGLPDAAPAPHRHRPVRRGRRPPGPPLARRGRHPRREHRDRRPGRPEAADLLLLNDGDLTYAKIRLDEAVARHRRRRPVPLDDSLAQALCWGAAWDMTRDAEMSASDFVDLVLANIGTETDAFGVSRIPGYGAQAVNSYSRRPTGQPSRRPGSRGCAKLLANAQPGSDHQLSFVRALASAAHSDQALDELEGLLEDSQSLEGLEVDADLRWTLLHGLARGPRGQRADRRELAHDHTISGQAGAAARGQACAEGKAEGVGAGDGARRRPTRRTAAWSWPSRHPARTRC